MTSRRDPWSSIWAHPHVAKGRTRFKIPPPVPGADSAAHALCKRPPAAAPAAVCSGCAALFALRGSRCREMAFRTANGAGRPRQLGEILPISGLKPPRGASSISAPALPGPRSSNSSARPRLNPARSSRSHRKRHPPQRNPAAIQPGKLFIIFSLQQRYREKKHPPSPGANSSSCSFHVGIYVHHSVKSIRKKKIHPSLKKLPKDDLKPGTRKKWLRK